ncbi:acetyltransferase [Leptospira ryugenii]|uniref:Acetyltransferase n=1 Tax=Leptospira ryugenii TaxID=1917863 RepID=A0A2P2DZ78_9LEPT|nr:acetyltransferase [Leptospira ryugenii]
MYLRGVFVGEELCSLLLGRIEEKPHLVEEVSFFIDLAVTKNGKKKSGYMKALLADLNLWCQNKQIPSIELRAILANQDAISFWDHSEFERFYIRYRKRVI